MRLGYRAILLIPLVCAGGPAAVACGDGFGPNCVGAGQRCSHVLPSCCTNLECTDTANGALCQRLPAQSAEAGARE
jgi:hypothetical protein